MTGIETKKCVKRKQGLVVLVFVIYARAVGFERSGISAKASSFVIQDKKGTRP